MTSLEPGGTEYRLAEAGRALRTSTQTRSGRVQESSSKVGELQTERVLGPEDPASEHGEPEGGEGGHSAQPNRIPGI